MELIKKLKLFSLLTLLVLAACSPGTEDVAAGTVEELSKNVVEEYFETEISLELTEIENRLDEIEVTVGMLESDFAEINSEGEALDALQLESRELLEQLEAIEISFFEYERENFRNHCIEEGGTFLSDEAEGSYSCALSPNPTFARERRDGISFRLFDLFNRLINFDYVFFGTHLSDFEKALDDIESTIAELEAVLDIDMALTDEETREKWENDYFADERWGDFQKQAHSIGNQLSAIFRGLDAYASAHPDRYPLHCNERASNLSDCPQFGPEMSAEEEKLYELLEVRRMEIGNRLGRIINSSGAVG